MARTDSSVTAPSDNASTPLPGSSATLQPAVDAALPTYAPLDPVLPTPEIPVPTPVSLLQGSEGVTFFALLGNDTGPKRGGRTDSILLVAVDPLAKRATLLSLPRDLYVVIPGWTMQRINLAYPHGAQEGGTLLKETLAYNLGLRIDYTVRVGFDGFKRIVDALGGIDVVVNCPVTDWRLKAPQLDPAVEENWELFELSYGVQPMDGELALWYARSRRSTSDFDRGRRQQKILRALWQEVRGSPEKVAQLPALARALWTAVDSDLAIDEALTLLRLLSEADGYSVRSLLLPQEALRAWTVPASGEAVQLLDFALAQATLHELVGEPALHTAVDSPIRVAIQSEDYVLYQQVAENLAWYGFEPVYEAPHAQPVEDTTIIYYGDSLKGAYADRLAWILRQETAVIQLQTRRAGETVDYRVRLSPTYNPCLNYLAGPPK